MTDNTSVRVAVRVRPLVPHETSRGCREIIEVIDENEQILIKSIDKDRAYSFDYVMSTQQGQDIIYNRCVKKLIHNLFLGYNVTILAYGQTGSGKTHTMGTAYSGEGDMGVIPRAVTDIYDFIKDNFSYDFSVSVSFVELYQELLYDLLSDKPRDQCILEIREDTVKGIHIPNITEVEVNSVRQVFDALAKGTAGRATSATAMNAQSSRSHAIFTVNIAMNHKENSTENKQAKLHLVDLAGSERPKKTQATGNTFKEGVTINKGLLALGNVISALGDEKSQHGFVPYRDSSLTRLLKDSLGGNSVTLMIACVSPADYNLEETVSTLRYADRAKKIKNKPIINQDPKAAEINALKKTIQHLRLQIVGQGGPVASLSETDIIKEAELRNLKNKNRNLTLQLSDALINNTSLHEKIIILQTANEMLNGKIGELKEKLELSISNITIGIETNNAELLKANLDSLQLIKDQFIEINNDQKNTEEEINDHDKNKYYFKQVAENQKDNSDDMDQQQEFHADRQIKLNVQLSELEQNLNMKVTLAKKLIDSNENLVDMQDMAENEAKIAQLEREKEELLQMLKNVGNSGKISEIRRKRVQELEQQLADLKKKVQEMNHLIKEKKIKEERIKTLQQDIIQMKQAKVKLVKTMREESEKFRQWKLEKEKECIRLKRQDIKKDHEINRMKVMHNKQQNVFKRRVEEAEAINKRLKQALALKKQTQDSRHNGKVEKLEPWLKQEFNLYVNLVEAEATLKVLLEDRATLQSQLDELKKNCGDGDNTAEIKNIEDDLDLRSVQIQDLQQKLLESDEDTRMKIRLEKFQTVAEFKFGLKFLYAKVAEVVREKVHLQMKHSELQETTKETLEKLNESHYNEVEMLRKEYDEKVDNFLLQIKECQNYELEKEEFLSEIKNLKRENTDLLNKIENIYAAASKSQVTPLANRTFNLHNGKKEEFSTPPPTINVISPPVNNENEDIIVIGTPLKEGFSTPISDKKIPSHEIDVIAATPINESLDMDFDDIKNDPDWKKTPLGKRIMEEKKKIPKPTLDFEEKPVKRSSEGGCTCKTNCGGPRCGCKKVGKSCSRTCRCKENSCQNKSSTSFEEPTETTEDFKKPNSLNEVPRKKKRIFYTLD